MATAAFPTFASLEARILFVMRYVMPPLVAVLAFFSVRETVAAVVAFFSG